MKNDDGVPSAVHEAAQAQATHTFTSHQHSYPDVHRVVLRQRQAVALLHHTPGMNRRRLSSCHAIIAKSRTSDSYVKIPPGPYLSHLTRWVEFPFDISFYHSSALSNSAFSCRPFSSGFVACCSRSGPAAFVSCRHSRCGTVAEPAS